MLEANNDVDTDDGDFLPVRNTRRPLNTKTKPDEITPNVQNQFEERASSLDWIGVPYKKLPSSSHDTSTKLKSESMDDSSHLRGSQNPFSSVKMIVDKAPSASQITASQVTSSRKKVPQPEEISSSVAFGIQTSASQSKAHVPNTLRPDDFPNLVGGSVQRPLHSFMSASGIPWGHVEAPDSSSGIDASVPTSLRFHRKTPTSERSLQEFCPAPKVSSQITSGQINSSTGIVWSKSHGQSETSSSPISFFQNLQTSTTARKPSVDPPPGLNGPSKIPEGVFVVCDHFLQDNRRRPASVYAAAKTCKLCENYGRLMFAIWNNINYHWQVMRPYPFSKIPPRVAFDVCRHFSTNRPCPKEPCTFPHGKQETRMWTLEREGREYINYKSNCTPRQ